MSVEQQTSLAWFDHPLIVFFLPYYRRDEVVELPYDRIQERFLSLHNKSILNDVPGVIAVSRRKYNVAVDSHDIHIDGPYGNKAWTMYAHVAIVPRGNVSILTVRTYPHRRIVLNMVFVLAFLTIAAFFMGFPSAPFFPLVVFVPFLYIATVAATKIESATIEAIVRRVSTGEQLTTSE